jgi:transcriptional repressor NrdR
MKCPHCLSPNSQVKDSRPSEDHATVKRRRYCLVCESRFTTLERVENKEIKVIKKDGKTRPFDSQKLTHSIEVATRKRLVNDDSIELIVSKIINNIQKLGDTAVNSKLIGELVLNELKNIDHVAYVRYASVYMDFTQIKDFSKLINSL